MNNYQLLHELMLKFSKLGIKNIKETGATLIGYAPHIGIEAWLNCLYPVLSTSDLYKLEEELKRPIPEDYKEFLTSFSNGLNILCDTLSLYGLRLNYSRNPQSVWQPYSIIEMNNKFNKPMNAGEQMLFIGSYDWDGSKIYMDDNNFVYYCLQNDATPIMKWDSLSSMLISEINRLYELFDSKGKQLNEELRTTPI